MTPSNVAFYRTWHSSIWPWMTRPSDVSTRMDSFYFSDFTVWVQCNESLLVFHSERNSQIGRKQRHYFDANLCIWPRIPIEPDSQIQTLCSCLRNKIQRSDSSKPGTTFQHLIVAELFGGNIFLIFDFRAAGRPGRGIPRNNHDWGISRFQFLFLFTIDKIVMGNFIRLKLASISFTLSNMFKYRPFLPKEGNC